MGIGPVKAVPRALENAGLTHRPDRPGRAERGLRLPGPRQRPRARHRGGAAQRQRRRDRPRPPARLLRRPPHRHPRPRAAPPRRQVRRRHPLRRRRPGSGHRLRSGLNARHSGCWRHVRLGQGRLLAISAARSRALALCVPRRRCRPRRRRARRPRSSAATRRDRSSSSPPSPTSTPGTARTRLRLHRHRGRAAGGPHRRPLRRGPRDRRLLRSRPNTKSRPASPTRSRDAPKTSCEVVATHVFPGFDPGIVHGDAALLILSQPDHRAAAGHSPAAGRGALYEGGAPVSARRLGPDQGQKPARRPRTCARPRSTVQKDTTCKRKTTRFYRPYSRSPAALHDRPARTRPTAAASATAAARRSPTAPTASPVELGDHQHRRPRLQPASCPTSSPASTTSPPGSAEWIAATETGARRRPRPDGAAAADEKSTGEEFAICTLFHAFGERFASASSLAGSCNRREHDPVPLRNRLDRRTDTIYAGIVSVFYVRKQQTFAWDSHYQVRWAPQRCLASDFSGRGCRIHSKRG